MSKSSAPTPVCTATEGTAPLLVQLHWRDPVRLAPLNIRASRGLRWAFLSIHWVVVAVLGATLCWSPLDGIWRLLIALLVSAMVALSWRGINSVIAAGTLTLSYLPESSSSHNSPAKANRASSHEASTPAIHGDPCWSWQTIDHRESLGVLRGARLWQWLVILEFSTDKGKRYLPLAADALDEQAYAALRRWILVHLQEARHSD